MPLKAAGAIELSVPSPISNGRRPAAVGGMGGSFRFLLTIFLSAFLLFQVQPMMGRFVLPWFGGGPTVWTTCMLFFQVLLVAGYAYAHWLGSPSSTRLQSSIPLLLLVASSSFLSPPPALIPPHQPL